MKINELILPHDWPYDDNDTVLLVYDSHHRISEKDLRELNTLSIEENLYYDTPLIGGLGGPERIPEFILFIIAQVALGVTIEVLADMIVLAIKRLVKKRQDNQQIVQIKVEYNEININFYCCSETPENEVRPIIASLLEKGNEIDNTNKDGLG